MRTSAGHQRLIAPMPGVSGWDTAGMDTKIVCETKMSETPDSQGRKRPTNRWPGWCKTCDTYVEAGTACVAYSTKQRRWIIFC